MRMRLALLPLLVLQLTAQDAPVELVRARVLGPAAWATRLRPTNLGSLLASTEAESVWRPWWEQVVAMSPALLGQEGATLPGRWLAYAGAVEVVVLARAGDDPDQPRISGTITFGAGGDVDAHGLAEASVRAAAGAAGVEFVAAAEDSEVRVARIEDWSVTLPQRGEGASRVCFGNDAESLRRLIAAPVAAPAEAPSGAGAPVAETRIDLAAIEALRRASGGSAEPAYDALGLASLRHLTVSFGARGPHVQAEIGLTFADGTRGVFDGLFPTSAGVPDLHWAVHPEARAWKVGRLDTLSLWRAVVRAIAADGTRTVAEVEEEAQEEAGVDIPGRLLGSLTDELALSLRLRHGAEDETDFAMLAVMRVRDEAAFLSAMKAMLAKSEDWTISERDGMWRASMPRSWFVPPIDFAVGKGIVGFALADDATEMNDWLVKRVGQQVAAPGDFTVPGRSAPAGWNGIGAVEAAILLREFLPDLFGLINLRTELPAGDRGEFMEAARELVALAEKHQLSRVLTLTGNTKTAWSFRILW